MSQDDWNARFEQGSARFATEADAIRMKMYRQTATSCFLGLRGGRPLYGDHPGAMLIVAPSRAGKGSELVTPNLMTGVQSGRTQVVLNTKGDLYHITKNQAADDKAVYCWNLDGRPDVPEDRVNPFEGMRWQSRTLESDTKTVCLGLIPDSASGKDKYFTTGGRAIMEALCYAVAKRDGVVTLPALYGATNAVRTGGAAWKRLAEDLADTENPLCQRVRAELDLYHADPHGGGMKDIIGELGNAMSFASDPNAMRAVTPPFSVSIKNDLCSAERFANFYIICEAEKLETHAPIIKALLNMLFLTKARLPGALGQDWILDETALLGSYPMVETLASYGPGFGIRPWFVFQNFKQADALGPRARQTIFANAQTQMFFGTRDLETCRMLSDMVGRETLEVDDPLTQSRGRHERDAMKRAILMGADPFEVGLAFQQKSYEATHRRKVGRSLMTPDEIRIQLQTKMLLFADGLPGPLLVDRMPYWKRRSLAGKYLPDPYHPPMDSVLVQTRWGQRRRAVITEEVDPRFAHLPQYADGQWSYVEGYKP
ncbi:type IV secretory system conjugative DNA transfer family protein [Roseobacter sp. MH60115]|uniref:type IV secretory system conjugative DNA transfer family protein n=1 Tax=Roseobacter sp. MH60115 TaxID=2785324 RepID=UPI0018A3082C|nr:type IV secretory system conjugative DNA transfer family protein [Roseobacter sp. MH60115]